MSPQPSREDAGSDARIADLEEELRVSAQAEDAHRHTEAGLRDALAYAESIVDTVREPLLVLDGELRVKTASHACRRKRAFVNLSRAEAPAVGRRLMLLNARKLWRESNNTERVLLAIEDITDRKRMEEEMLRSNEDLQRFAYVAAHDLRATEHRP
jgi:PAS domain-containing protein